MSERCPTCLRPKDGSVHDLYEAARADAEKWRDVSTRLANAIRFAQGQGLDFSTSALDDYDALAAREAR